MRITNNSTDSTCYITDVNLVIENASWNICEAFNENVGGPAGQWGKVTPGGAYPGYKEWDAPCPDTVNYAINLGPVPGGDFIHPGETLRLKVCINMHDIKVKAYIGYTCNGYSTVCLKQEHIN